jgi:di/tripeptidase
MFLNDTEIADLTKRKRAKAQQKQLNAMGIQHKVRADGSLVILRAHVDTVLGGQTQVPRQRQSRQPNWEALAHA